MFTCTVFQNTFAFYSGYVSFSPHPNPLESVYILPRYFSLFLFLFIFFSLSRRFIASSCKMWPLWLLGHMVRVRRDNLLLVGSVLWWLPAFLKKVILSKEKKKRGELHNCSKWTSEDLLRIKTTLISCFRIQLWPNWGLVGWRYIYYTTLSAQNLLTSRLYRQGKTPCP